MKRSITILGGRNKSGVPEPIQELAIQSGQIYSIVGFTGSGKSRLIGDIEQLAQGDTISGRRVLLDGRVPEYKTRYNPQDKLIAQLSQTMNFALEMKAKDFLYLHAKCRNIPFGEREARQTLDTANTLAGEPIREDDLLTQLSGGQSRALMIADLVAIGNSPIVLVDEVENAGIDRKRAMELLAEKGKIVLIVTHDPLLALLGEKRVVMRNGGMDLLIQPDSAERAAYGALEDMTSRILAAQERIRRGDHVSIEDMENHEIPLAGRNV